jgi:hypothetical protein
MDKKCGKLICARRFHLFIMVDMQVSISSVSNGEVNNFALKYKTATTKNGISLTKPKVRSGAMED